MNLVVKQFSLEGLYQGIRPLQSVFTSLCCVSNWPKLLRTNTNQRRSCRLGTQTEFQRRQMHFYELYIVHQEANNTKLINVPLRVASFTRAGNLRNQVICFPTRNFHLDQLVLISQDSDVSRWQLSKRFFNIDVVSGSNGNERTDFVRYLSSLSIRFYILLFR